MNISSNDTSKVLPSFNTLAKIGKKHMKKPYIFLEERDSEKYTSSRVIVKQFQQFERNLCGFDLEKAVPVFSEDEKTELLVSINKMNDLNKQIKQIMKNQNIEIEPGVMSIGRTKSSNNVE